ncbi:MAG: hypothetical protein N3B12_08455, partial [Armatimonadetes bacterium]|nr:hypothetical protein [Armatimonadota bacterium]
MKIRHDLSQLRWTLSGWTPELWRLERTMEVGASPNAEIYGIPARVPGSVQMSLRDAGILPDWNVGLNYRLCEWVENRQWIYEVAIPDEWVAPFHTPIPIGKQCEKLPPSEEELSESCHSSKEKPAVVRLNCRGLDYSGSIFLNENFVSEFAGSHTPHVFDITKHLAESGNVLRIVFDPPPRWLGQFGFTSRMKDWKPRFNYTWDWVVRLVQIGISAPIFLEITDGTEITAFRVTTGANTLNARGHVAVQSLLQEERRLTIKLTLSRNDQIIREEVI